MLSSHFVPPKNKPILYCFNQKFGQCHITVPFQAIVQSPFGCVTICPVQFRPRKFSKNIPFESPGYNLIHTYSVVFFWKRFLHHLLITFSAVHCRKKINARSAGKFTLESPSLLVVMRYEDRNYPSSGVTVTRYWTNARNSTVTQFKVGCHQSPQVVNSVTTETLENLPKKMLKIIDCATVQHVPVTRYLVVQYHWETLLVWGRWILLYRTSKPLQLYILSKGYM